ncbi:MAG: class I SAM-dependent methyltransferase [Oligoflexales bacterium]
MKKPFFTTLRRMYSMMSHEVIPLYATWLRTLPYSSHSPNFLKAVGRSLVKGGFHQDELEFFRQVMTKHSPSKFSFIGSCYRLPEAILPIAKAVDVNRAHHEARVALVKQLPPARRILDLGGASDTFREGAFLAMGYPHKPDEVWIIDQPPESRTLYAPPAEERDCVFRSTRVHYVHQSMVDLRNLPEGYFDLVWSGQGIEHVTEEEFQSILNQVKKLLVPNGRFCFDTPNENLARLISPYSFLHQEHKLEYSPERLSNLVKRNGYRLNRMAGVSPMPISHRIRRFCRWEVVENVLTEDRHFESGYSLYIDATPLAP